MENIISHRGFVAQGNFLARVNGEFHEAKGGKVGAFDYEILAKEGAEYRAFAVRLTNRTPETLRIGDIRLFRLAEETPPASERVIYRFTDSWTGNAVLKTSAENGSFETTPMFFVTDDQGGHVLIAQFSFQHNKVLFRSAFAPDGRIAEVECLLPSYDCDVAPGEAIETDYIAFYHTPPRDPSAALYLWAEQARLENDIPVPCASFAGMTGGSSVPYAMPREELIDYQLDNAKTLQKLGCKYFWISISNLLGTRPGNWLYPNDQQFPHGLRNLLDKIRERGFIPGFWFGVFYITEDCKDFEKVKPFLMRKRDGSLTTRKVWRWCPPREDGTLPKLHVLDPGKPGAAEYVADVLRTYAEWGIRYYMLDFLRDGIYQDDDQPTGYAYEAYIKFMRRLRKFVTPDTHLLSAVGTSCLLMGACDSGRIGPDYCESRANYKHWPTHPATYAIGGTINSCGGCHRHALGSLAMWSFADRSFFKGNSNIIKVDTPIPLCEVKTAVSLFGISASPVIFGDNMKFLDPARKKYVKLILPRSDVSPVPVNLFTKTDMEDDFVSIFKVEIEKPWGSYYVVAVFNMNDTFRSVKLTPELLGIPQGKAYCYYDFWEEKYMGTTAGEYTAEVPPQTPTVLRIEERRTHPWLLSTDLTLRQGESEIADLRWDDSSMTLSGRAVRAAGEEGNLYFLMADGWAPVSSEGLIVARYIRDWDMVIRKHIVFEHDAEDFEIKFQPSDPTAGREDVKVRL